MADFKLDRNPVIFPLTDVGSTSTQEANIWIEDPYYSNNHTTTVAAPFTIRQKDVGSFGSSVTRWFKNHIIREETADKDSDGASYENSVATIRNNNQVNYVYVDGIHEYEFHFTTSNSSLPSINAIIFSNDNIVSVVNDDLNSDCVCSIYDGSSHVETTYSDFIAKSIRRIGSSDYIVFGSDTSTSSSKSAFIYVNSGVATRKIVEIVNLEIGGVVADQECFYDGYAIDDNKVVCFGSEYSVVVDFTVATTREDVVVYEKQESSNWQVLQTKSTHAFTDGVSIGVGDDNIVCHAELLGYDVPSMWTNDAFDIVMGVVLPNENGEITKVKFYEQRNYNYAVTITLDPFATGSDHALAIENVDNNTSVTSTILGLTKAQLDSYFDVSFDPSSYHEMILSFQQGAKPAITINGIKKTFFNTPLFPSGELEYLTLQGKFNYFKYRVNGVDMGILNFNDPTLFVYDELGKTVYNRIIGDDYLGKYAFLQKEFKQRGLASELRLTTNVDSQYVVCVDNFTSITFDDAFKFNRYVASIEGLREDYTKEITDLGTEYGDLNCCLLDNDNVVINSSKQTHEATPVNVRTLVFTTDIDGNIIYDVKTLEIKFSPTAEDIYHDMVEGSVVVGESVSATYIDALNNSMIVVDGDYKDFLRIDDCSSLSCDCYCKDNNQAFNDYIYSSSTGKMVQVGAGMGEYRKVTVHPRYQELGNDIVSYAVSQNINFDPTLMKQNISDSAISFHGLFGVADKKISLSYTHDSNYNVLRSKKYFKLGEEEETGSSSLDNPKFMGSKQVTTVSAPINGRIANSIKFKIMPENDETKVDDFIMYFFDIRSAKSLFVDEGEE